MLKEVGSAVLLHCQREPGGPDNPYTTFWVDDCTAVTGAYVGLSLMGLYYKQIAS